jgi:hypothetical protein
MFLPIAVLFDALEGPHFVFEVEEYGVRKFSG